MENSQLSLQYASTLARCPFFWFAAIQRRQRGRARPERIAFATLGMLAFLLSFCARAFSQAQSRDLGFGDRFSVSSNLDAGYRRTQFFAPHYNTALFQWDSRFEVWFPPFRDRFSWGPYVRVAGIKGSQDDAWQNAWLGGPGVGFQVYPLSSWRFQGQDSLAGRLFGPLRVFAEYNFTNYWGNVNTWRPRNQTRTGLDYWKAVNVNEPQRFWWMEIWNGLYWQSANEFTNRYDSVMLGNSLRVGIRESRSRAISTLTPYVALESSRTKYDYAGPNGCLFAQPGGIQNPCDFYWENRLLTGAGLRFAPSLGTLGHGQRAWLSRFVVYGEYLNTATYYGPSAPSSIPRFEVRLGLSANIGHWYR
jgi:hypothetical protein